MSQQVRSPWSATWRGVWVAVACQERLCVRVCPVMENEKIGRGKFLPSISSTNTSKYLSSEPRGRGLFLPQCTAS